MNNYQKKLNIGQLSLDLSPLRRIGIKEVVHTTQINMNFKKNLIVYSESSVLTAYIPKILSDSYESWNDVINHIIHISSSSNIERAILILEQYKLKS